MSGFFGTRHKLAVHLTQAAVVVVVLTLAGVRLFTRPKNVPMVRTDSMALAIGVKSHVVIFYQILTEHYPKFRRWASLKANLILNSLEIVFWAAVAFMGIQANTQTCDGTRCILSWIVVGLGIALSIMASYTAVVSFFEFRQSRNNKMAHGPEGSMRNLYSRSADDSASKRSESHKTSAV